MNLRKLLKRILIILVVLLVGVPAGGLVYQALATVQDVARFPVPGELFDIGGRELHLRCMGSGSPTVILEAGGGTSSILWGPFQEQLAEFSRVCSYDRAGFGWSDPGPIEPSFKTFLD